MRRNRLGRGEIEVTELSFGAAPIGNLFSPVETDQAHAAIEAAWDIGIRYFDTAPHYGLGLSEERLGDALRGRPGAEFVVSTKVGRVLEPMRSAFGDDLDHGYAVPATHRRIWDFSADGVRRSLESSLARLGLDRVDLVYLHDVDGDHVQQAVTEGYPALERLRADGTVGAIGVGTAHTGVLTRFVRDTDVDAVLCPGRYTLLEQSALTELLPEAAARGTSVVIGSVFNSGVLAHPEPGATYDYAYAPEPVLDRARRIQAVTERHGVPLRAAALRFPFGHAAVPSVLVGMRSANEARDAAAMLRQPIPDDLWAELRAEGLLPETAPAPAAPGL